MENDKCPFCGAGLAGTCNFPYKYNCGTEYWIMGDFTRKDQTKFCKIITAAKFAIEEFENGYGAGHSKFCECGMCNLKKEVNNE